MDLDSVAIIFKDVTYYIYSGIRYETLPKK